MSFYIQFPTIKGSVTEKNHQGWVKVESIDFGTHRHIYVPPGAANNGDISVSQVSDFVIVKSLDKASPYLLEKSLTGGSLGEVIIHGYHTSNTQGVYLEYKLQNVMISHYDVSGISSGNEDALSETLHLNFTEVQMKYVPISEAGKLSSPIISGYDIGKASKL